MTESLCTWPIGVSDELTQLGFFYFDNYPFQLYIRVSVVSKGESPAERIFRVELVGPGTDFYPKPTKRRIVRWRNDSPTQNVVRYFINTYRGFPLEQPQEFRVTGVNALVPKSQKLLKAPPTKRKRPPP